MRRTLLSPTLRRQRKFPPPKEEHEFIMWQRVEPFVGKTMTAQYKVLSICLRPPLAVALTFFHEQCLGHKKMLNIFIGNVGILFGCSVRMRLSSQSFLGFLGQYLGHWMTFSFLEDCISLIRKLFGFSWWWWYRGECSNFNPFQRPRVIHNEEKGDQ